MCHHLLGGSDVGETICRILILQGQLIGDVEVKDVCSTRVQCMEMAAIRAPRERADVTRKFFRTYCTNSSDVRRK